MARAQRMLQEYANEQRGEQQVMRAGLFAAAGLALALVTGCGAAPTLSGSATPAARATSTPSPTRAPTRRPTRTAVPTRTATRTATAPGPTTAPSPTPEPTERPRPTEPPAPPPADPPSQEQLRAWLEEARATHPYAEPVASMWAVMMCESSGRPDVIAGPYHGLFQYIVETWRGAWNPYRDSPILDPRAQIFATAKAWQDGHQSWWGGCLPR
jgi:hypothetical protein